MMNLRRLSLGLGALCIASAAQALVINHGGPEVSFSGDASGVTFVNGQPAVPVKGNGHLATEHRLASMNFDGLALYGAYSVQFTRSDTRSIRVRTDANLMAYVKTNLHAGVVHVSMEPGIWSPTQDIVIEVQGPTISSVTSSGSTKLNLSNLRQPRIRVQADGSATLSLTGNVTLADIAVHGSGNVDAQKLRASDVKLSLAGSAKAQVHASESISVNAAGSADVVVYGTPAEKDVNTAGPASVKFMGSHSLDQ